MRIAYKQLRLQRTISPDYTEIGAEVKEKILGYLDDANSYRSDSLIVKAELVGGVKEGEDVFGWYADLDIVDVIEDVAATGFEYLDIFSHVLGDFGRLGKGQDVLGINTASPEDKLFAKGLF